MVIDQDFLDSANSGPRRRGKNEIIKYLEGGRISRGQAIKAKCFDCDGMGETGECDMVHCPLYPYSPYKTRVSAKSASTGSSNAI